MTSHLFALNSKVFSQVLRSKRPRLTKTQPWFTPTGHRLLTAVFPALKATLLEEYHETLGGTGPDDGSLADPTDDAKSTSTIGAPTVRPYSPFLVLRYTCGVYQPDQNSPLYV